MGRKIQHNNIVTDELLAQCNKENIELGNDFLDYLRSVDRSPNTINAYRRDLFIFWVIYFSIATINSLLICLREILLVIRAFVLLNISGRQLECVG